MITVSDNDVIFSSPRTLHAFREVTYIITLEDGPLYNLQFSSAADLDDFAVRVSFKRLYRGTYKVRAYGDKSITPYSEGSFKMKEEGL